MNWDFVVDMGFYALLGMLLLVPCTYLVAAIRRRSFGAARAEVREHLDQWVAAADAGSLGKLLGVAGFSTALVLLGFGAYGASRAGDAAMPMTLPLVRGYGMKAAAWSIVEEKGSWDSLGFAFREITGIRGDEAAWERQKADLGRYDIRFFRTAFVLFALMVLAGLVDLRPLRGRRKSEPIEVARSRARGAAVLVASIAGLLASHYLWAERQEKFVMNLVARYENTYYHKHEVLPERPESYPYKRREIGSPEVWRDPSKERAPRGP